MTDWSKLYDEFLYDCYIANQHLTEEDWHYYGREEHHIEIPDRDGGLLTTLNSQYLTKYQHWVAGVLQSEVLGKCCFAFVPKDTLPRELELLRIKWLQLQLTPEQRVAMGVKGSAARTFEERSATMTKVWAERTPRERSEIGKKASDNKTLEHHQNLARLMNAAQTPESRRRAALKGAESLTEEFKVARSRAGGGAATKQRWQCTVTGKVSCAAPLTRWQQARGIDPSNRVRRYDLEQGG
jgi:hypothetical protein